MEFAVTSGSGDVYSEAAFNDLDDEQLSKLLEETLQANDVLAAETEMFERYFTFIKSRDNTTSSINLVHSPGTASRDNTHRRRSKSHSSSSERPHKLTSEQKCDIALREIEELRVNSLKLDEESEKVMDIYRAMMEEADIRLTELKKETYEFDRSVLKGAVDPRTQKIIAEKCLRFFDEKIKSRESLVEKLRLKNCTLKVQMKKLKVQLKQKEEMGEVLKEVDFNQLKIENHQYLEKIDERNQDLLRLKLMTGNALQVLNSYKKRLHTITLESKRLKSEIISRHELHGKLNAETKMVELDRSQAERINKTLRKNLTDFRVPDVMEYVLGKADIYDLQKKIQNWERKIDIAELALKTHRKAWETAQIRLQEQKRWNEMVNA